MLENTLRGFRRVLLRFSIKSGLGNKSEISFPAGANKIEESKLSSALFAGLGDRT